MNSIAYILVCGIAASSTFNPMACEASPQDVMVRTIPWTEAHEVPDMDTSPRDGKNKGGKDKSHVA